MEVAQTISDTILKTPRTELAERLRQENRDVTPAELQEFAHSLGRRRTATTKMLSRAALTIHNLMSKLAHTIDDLETKK